MDIVSIVKTKEEDITLEDYDKNLKQDVYTITYFDNKKNKYVFQCLGGSDRFIIFLKLYEKKMKRVEELIKDDIRPFFFKEKFRRGLISFPIGLAVGFGFFCLNLIPIESMFFSELLGYVSFGLATVSCCLPIVYIRDVEYNEENVQTYVPDKNVVNSFKSFSKKKQAIAALKRKYAKEIKTYDIENSEESAEKERIEIQRKYAEEKQENIRKEMERTLLEIDYRDYLALNASQKRALYERALELRKNGYFKKDVPSFLERDQQREMHFLDFALHDEFNLTNTAPPVKNYRAVLFYGSGTNDYDEVENSRENRGGRRR